MDKSDFTKLQHYIDKKIKGTELQILGPRRIAPTSPAQPPTE